jgi:hypothetical protein
MADPVTAAAALAAGSALAGGAADFTSGMYQSKVADYNAKIARDNAKRALQRTDIEAQENDRLTGELIGTQEAVQGASGLSITGKSAAAVRNRTRVLGRRDSLNIRQGGEIEAYNYRVQKNIFKSQAKSARTSAYLNLAGSVLDAGSSIVGAAKPTAK